MKFAATTSPILALPQYFCSCCDFWSQITQSPPRDALFGSLSRIKNKGKLSLGTIRDAANLHFQSAQCAEFAQNIMHNFKTLIF